ncbi:MAG: RlmE family RNA methyltransferase [Hyphomicrobiaceae bacterium]
MAKGPGKSGVTGGVGSGRGDRALKVRVKSKAKRANSSRRWLERQLNDPYVAAAQKAGYMSRAAFKLIEINDKHTFLKPGQVVVDLGAAPGGWTQVLVDKVKALDGRGQVVAIDILEMEAIPGAEIIHLDFMAESAPERLKTMLRDGGADVVVSDMAAPTTGHARTDHLQIMGLAETAAEFATEVLRPGGVFLCKVFQGGTERELLDLLKRQFKTVRHVKPPASRQGSSELYVLATGFRGAALPEDAD